MTVQVSATDLAGRALKHIQARKELIESAKGDFTTYKRYVWRKYKHARHLDMIDQKLMQVVRYIESGGKEGIGRLIISLPPRHGKALALDTPIPTPSGWTTMGELKVGDLVFDEKGRPTRVMWVSPVWKDRPVYEVTTDDGDSIIADAEHEWLVRLDRKWPVQHTKTTRYLAERTCSRKPMVTNAWSLVLPERELPIDPYVLGVWLGDGNSRCARITSSILDQSYTRAEIERAGYKTSTHADPTAFGVSDLQKKLRLNGLLKNKHIPDAYLRASREQRLSLLQGLIDTDGYVAKDGQVEFCSTNLRLAEGVSELVHSLGYKASIILGRAVLRGKDCGPKYRVMFYMPDAARMPRKRDRCVTPKKQPNRYLSFRPAGVADTVCIEVESPSHLFLCGRSMIPTHNSASVARLLPAFFMGRNPDKRVILGSYGATLSEKHSRFVRDLMRGKSHQDVFPGVSPSRDSGAKDAWDIRPPHEGGMDAVGKGGAITGKGADLIIIDDLVKSRAEAESPNIRESDWEWYKDDLVTRLEPGGAIAVIATRWHEDDVIGRLLLNQPEMWDTLILPAIAEDGDPMGRAPGEACWPDRFPRKVLDERRRTLGEYSFQSLYQQNPKPKEGGLFRRSNVTVISEAPTDITRQLRFWDLAMSDKKTADYTVGVKFGITAAGNIVILDVVRKQVEWAKVPDLIKRTALEDGPAVPHAIEAAFYQTQVVSTLLRDQELYRHVFRPVPPESDKYSRALPWSARWGAGQVFLLRRTWTQAYIDEHCAFPFGTNDDQVDASTGALSSAMGVLAPVRVAKRKMMA